jgi:asparagine synthase (glutamine-hydrolysing)
MCGIAAFFSRKRPLSEETLRRATTALRHRGPDSQRHWLSNDQRVGLGHARLSIIDLAGRDQPIAHEARFYRLTPSGRKQLAEERSNWERLSTAVNQVLKTT